MGVTGLTELVRVACFADRKMRSIIGASLPESTIFPISVRAEPPYQLIRQKGQVADRTFEIEFLDPGVQAFSLRFG